MELFVLLYHNQLSEESYMPILCFRPNDHNHRIILLLRY
nr:MAG TPA: hypothetical protein [Caudoviricetes sp.]